MIQLIISGEVSEEYVFFTDLYQRYQRLMYSVAKRYAASENEAEDIMQDAVERLLKRIPKLMELPGCTLPTYLVYTVRSTAVNFKRHQNVIEKHTLPIDYDDGNTYVALSENITYSDNGRQIFGIFGSLLATHMLVPLIISLVILISGLLICFLLAFSKKQ